MEDKTEILRRALETAQEIRDLEEQRRQIREMMDGMQGFDYGKPIVKSSAGRGSVESTALKAAALEERIQEKIGALLEIRAQAARVIDVLPSGACKSVMVQRYLLGKRFEDIARELGYSYRHVLRLHSRGISEIRERCH